MSGDIAPPATAREVADAVLAVPGVTGLYGGVFGEIATYLPGGRINGVVVSDNAVDVHIVVDMTHDLIEVAGEVRALSRRLTGVPATVTVEDITVGTDIVGSGATDTGATGVAEN